ncbi:MAG TPA: hypothetical protein VG186_08075 [Solirubrobacteraceae bacterium]|jgi:hypothetical protein|nr:hypothetical protein [Solirubrobacteraceae bacterium]
MLVTAVALSDVILAVHIAAVLITFGVIFSYPVIYLASGQLGPQTMAGYYRIRALLGRRLISPGLALVLAAGIYLASDLHQWKHFYTQWGIVVVVVIGAITGAFSSPRERRLAELAERESSGAEYQALAKRVAIVDLLLLVLVLATVYVMTVHAG